MSVLAPLHGTWHNAGTEGHVSALVTPLDRELPDHSLLLPRVRGVLSVQHGVPYTTGPHANGRKDE